MTAAARAKTTPSPAPVFESLHCGPPEQLSAGIIGQNEGAQQHARPTPLHLVRTGLYSFLKPREGRLAERQYHSEPFVALRLATLAVGRVAWAPCNQFAQMRAQEVTIGDKNRPPITPRLITHRV